MTTKIILPKNIHQINTNPRITLLTTHKKITPLIILLKIIIKTITNITIKMTITMIIITIKKVLKIFFKKFK